MSSHSRWYWGLKLYVLTTPDGSPVAWCLASPKLGEREVAMALLDRGSLRPGQVLIVDKGLAGAEVDRHVAGLQAVLLRPDRCDEPARFGSLPPVRQWIESVSTPSRASLGWSSTAAAPRPGPRPHCPATAGAGHGRLVQLAAWRAGQALAGRLRPLNP